MPALEELHTFTTPQDPAAVLAALTAAVEPTPWPPALMLKISGGGIVSQVMETPKTEHPLFGLVSEQRIRLAVSSRGKEVTPFQPILIMTLDADEETGGSRLQVKLRPHKQARSFAGLFAIIGALIIVAAIPAAWGGDPFALLGLLVGGAGLFFPQYRAQTCFQIDRDRALETLHTVLPELSSSRTGTHPT